MARKNSFLTVTDQFCGAGGSSQGVRRLSKRIKGVEIKLAMNHWKLAIETHNTNFPNTLHDCTDISACDPRRYPSTDILITSPECTTHSPAGGNNHKALKKQMDLFDTGTIDPATERSRATMWDVCRFAEYHQYNVIVVENVVEAKTRWPLFDVWLMAMHKLGYDHKCCYINSQHLHPTPQSRDRMYVVFWKKGNRAPDLELMPRAFCSKCCKDVDSVQAWKNPLKKYGKYKQQYLYACPHCTSVVEPYYFAAMNVIDWSDLGTRIGDRAKPLSPKSVSRIEYGLDKFGGTTFQFHSAYGEEARGVVRSISGPGFTQATTLSTAIAGIPFIIKLEHSQRIDNLSSVSDVDQTQTTRQSKMLVHNIKSVLDVLQTQTTTQGIGVAFPNTSFLTVSHGKSKVKSMYESQNSVTAGGITTGLVTADTVNSFLSYYNGGSNIASHITEAARTQPCNERAALITYDKPRIEDCYYRMLKPREIKLSMAFDSNYVILGNSREQVKQSGNAVTPPAMEWLVERCIQSLN